MKLIIYSILCGAITMALSSFLLGFDGSQVNGTGIMILGLIGFSSPGIYVLNKLYEISKEETDEIGICNQNLELDKLIDIGVLSYAEIDEITKLSHNKDAEKEYIKILTDLKDVGYLNDEDLSYKIYKLKEYYKVN